MVAADVSGLSLNAYESDGDDQYGEYDKIGRGDIAWHAFNIAHTEFSPVDNLARYGWDKFKSDGRKSARGLAWPLHAIADASCPHHLVGTTSWGHRPYEDWVELAYPSLVKPGDDAQRKRILAEAYFWWDAFKKNNEDIRGLIENVGVSAEAIRTSGPKPDWPYNDLASFDYSTGAKAQSKEYYAQEGPSNGAGLLMESAVAATLGFLVAVSEKVVDPGFAPSTKCAPDEHYDPATFACVPGAPPPPPPVVFVDIVCPSNQSCVDAGPDGGCQLPCETIADCPNSTEYTCTGVCCIAIPK